MRKKLAVLFLGAALTVSMLGACGGKDAASSSASAVSASSAADASSASVQDASKAESSTSTSDVSAESASAAETAGESSASELEDGTYTADFNTDSNMFHVNEAKEGKGVLTVKDGKMTIHVSLVSQNIVNVFVGTKEEAQADGAELIEPTTDEVTYSDGTTDEVYGCHGIIAGRIGNKEKCAPEFSALIDEKPGIVCRRNQVQRLAEWISSCGCDFFPQK